MKKISICIPCYNEVENVRPLCDEIVNIFNTKLSNYDYEILFIDNNSQDHTQEEIRKICSENKKVKAIFNARNFKTRSGHHGILQTSGDCSIMMVADFQDPPELLVQFVEKWEQGAMIVCGIKNSSKESKLKYHLRGFYYKFMQKFSEANFIEQFTGFGLYDKKVMDFFRTLNDPCPYLRGWVAEFGYDIEKIYYVQPLRKSGKSKNGMLTLIDKAIDSVTIYSKVGMRLATILGLLCSLLSAIIAIVYLVAKLIYWERFSAGMAPMLIGVFFIGSIQLLFLGVLGEYIWAINKRLMNRPLVLERCRINFESDEAI